MIVSASRRTDIPAFFSTWFINRLREGFVYVRNPMNPYQISKISLSPRVVDCIVFWTKNPRPLFNHYTELTDYNYYFQYTINSYGKTLEPNTPSIDDNIEMFRLLSKKIGKVRTIWRYDPVLITNNYTIQWHISNFKSIAKSLAGYTRKCVISFLDLYKKTKRNLLGIPLQSIDNAVIIEIASNFQTLAQKNGIEINTCAEEIDLSTLGIYPGKCIDDKLIEEIIGIPIKVGKDKIQRKICGCVASVDIGSYNTCPHGCLYCYANYNYETVRKNYAIHDPKSPLLFGNVSKRDKIIEKKVSSCIEIQQRLL